MEGVVSSEVVTGSTGTRGEAASSMIDLESSGSSNMGFTSTALVAEGDSIGAWMVCSICKGVFVSIAAVGEATGTVPPQMVEKSPK